MRALALLPLGLLVFLLPVPATSQYLFLDTNGDGIHDGSDQLAPSGPTSVDIWIVTNRNRDGTSVSCDVADAGNGLTINSYSVVLHSAGGSVKWGPMQNRLPFSELHPACFATYEDTTGTDWYHNGWGWQDQFTPGKHLVANIQIEVLSGNPSIFVEPYLPRRVVQITAFGTSCMALEGDNTYKLGLDWNDADGLGPLRAAAGGPYEVQAGRTLTVNGSGSRNMTGASLTYLWDFGDGATAATAIASHAYTTPGDYPLILSVHDDTASDSDTTNVHVVPTNAPFARISGPAFTYVGVGSVFDASASYDVDGDAIRYSWDFGDGTGRVDAVRTTHTYGTAGSYTVSMTVSDGMLSDTATRRVTVYPVPHPPVAVAGGPYSGLMGRLVSVDGSRSSDPDGDLLLYVWSFGDRSGSVGAATGHVYSAPGVYTVVLTVNDGGLSSSATTTATITESLPARVFADGPALYVPGQSDPMTVHLEPADASYRREDVNVWPITMRSPGTGTMDEIASMADATLTPDSDGNGVPELTFTYSPEELALLFQNAQPGAVITTRIKGDFYGGGYFTSDFTVHIGSAGLAAGPLRITPNPFNPQAVVTFSTSKAGAVHANLFNVHGRLVRTMRYGVMEAGRHVLPLDARSDDGVVLASGIYFFRLTGPDGVTTRRVAVAK